MGMNFYLCKGNPRLERGAAALYIGKSSYGWCFMLRVYPTIGITSLDDWKRMWAQHNEDVYTVRDGYGGRILSGTMDAIIEHRAFSLGWHLRFSSSDCDEEAKFHAENSSERGPNNLLRLRIGKGRFRHCVGHGEGTWDYIKGDASPDVLAKFCDIGICAGASGSILKKRGDE